MRSAGVRDSARGLQSGDHLCWGYRSLSELDAVAEALIADASTQGDRFAFYSDWPSAESSARLGRLAGAAELMERAAAETLSLAELPDHTLEQRSTMFLEASKQAVRDGFAGLRVLVDSTEVARTPESLLAWVACEQQADRQYRQARISVVCAYDVNVIGVAAVTELAAVHPLVSRHVAHQAFATDGAAIALRGEFDATSVTFLEQVLDRLPPGGHELVIDASGVDFINARNLAVIDRHAQHTGRDHIELRDAPPVARRVLELVPMPRLRLADDQ